MIQVNKMKKLKSIIKEMYAHAKDYSPEAGNDIESLFKDVSGLSDDEVKVELDIELDDIKPEDYQGDIRNVSGAELVYKREQPDGNYEELWLLNVGKEYPESHEIQRNILAGTDIDPGHLSSEDGSQELEIYSVGNVMFMQITGMPH